MAAGEQLGGDSVIGMFSSTDIKLYKIFEDYTKNKRKIILLPFLPQMPSTDLCCNIYQDPYR